MSKETAQEQRERSFYETMQTLEKYIAELSGDLYTLHTFVKDLLELEDKDFEDLEEGDFVDIVKVKEIMDRVEREMKEQDKIDDHDNEGLW